jgi:hypothetical protein
MGENVQKRNWWVGEVSICADYTKYQSFLRVANIEMLTYKLQKQGQNVSFVFK